MFQLVFCAAPSRCASSIFTSEQRLIASQTCEVTGQQEYAEVIETASGSMILGNLMADCHNGPFHGLDGVLK